MNAGKTRSAEITSVFLITALSISIVVLSAYVACSTFTWCNRLFKEPVIGFYSMPYIDLYYSNTAFTIMNAQRKADGSNKIDIIHLVKNLSIIHGSRHTLKINLGYVLSDPLSAGSHRMTYTSADGQKHIKTFPPLFNSKLRQIPDKNEITRRMAKLADIYDQFSENIESLIVFDEPYIHGVSKPEIERLISVIRQYFSDRGIDGVRLGITFAAGMFDAGFAREVDISISQYTKGIDDYYNNLKPLLGVKSIEAANFENWLKIIKKHRLTTYDMAGNIYTAGGIPEGIDEVSFDFHLSSILFDSMFSSIPKWYENQDITDRCAPFRDQVMSKWRNRLSFFNNSNKDDIKDNLKDKRLLDSLFSCRINGTMNLLKRQFKKQSIKPEIMLIGESSANGLRDFQTNGQPAVQQDPQAIKQRIADEVNRNLDFYKKYRNVLDGGLAFFIYGNAFDGSINQKIFGVRDLPKTLGSILDAANQNNCISTAFFLREIIQ